GRSRSCCRRAGGGSLGPGRPPPTRPARLADAPRPEARWTGERLVGSATPPPRRGNGGERALVCGDRPAAAALPGEGVLDGAPRLPAEDRARLVVPEQTVDLGGERLRAARGDPDESGTGGGDLLRPVLVLAADRG